ncbi:hypothetical protein KKG63_01795, partial [Patescibacteria group bacterium]|nr:hypothetical protein [Patescibacteria group bacterium]
MKQRFWKPGAKNSEAVKFTKVKGPKKGLKALGVTGAVLAVVLVVVGLVIFKFVVDPALALKGRADKLKEDAQ